MLSTAMKIGLEVWSGSYGQVESTCLLAEEVGIDAFYYGESPHALNLDCWTTLAGLARSTSRIRLGPVISNVLPTYRSVVLLARQAAAVNSMAGGRVDFRTGAGASARFGRPWWEPYDVTYGDYDQRLADLAASLERIPQIWAAEGVELPITLAARGDRAMKLAATYAHVWETSFCTPEEFAAQKATMTTLLDGRTSLASLEIDGFVASSRAGVHVLTDRVRAERGEAEDLDPVFERALVGTPDEAVVQLQALAESGVDQVVVALHDPHDHDGVRAVGEMVSLLAEGVKENE
ncbi:MAG: LLM class flavin-dependent oxidoreductase [Acidimicrobiales bacterium]|nr:LLM class flavin-dependent oxidoreductase [Acidimicrobiales bacterium]